MHYSAFIHNIIKDLKKEKHIESYVFIVPCKLSISYLKDYIMISNNTTYWMPLIYTMAGFMEAISSIEISNDLVLYIIIYDFILYKDYNIFSSFDEFMVVAKSIINIFNIIDLNMLNSEIFFNYILDKKILFPIFNTYIKKNVCKFLHNLYYDIKEEFINKGIGYKGFVFKQALTFLSSYVSNTIFIMSNVLNNIELYFLNSLLSKNKLNIYWNVNHIYYDKNLNKEILSYFKYLHLVKEYRCYYDYNSGIHVNNKIFIVSAYGYNNQISYINNILYKIKNINKYKIGIFITDNNLTIPLIHGLRTEFLVKSNFSVSYSLKKTIIYETFFKFFSLYINRIKISDSGFFYFKDFFIFMSDFFIKKIFASVDIFKFIKYNDDVISYNFIYKTIIDRSLLLLLSNTYNDVMIFLNFMQNIINKIRCNFLNYSAEYIYRTYSYDVIFSLYALNSIETWICDIIFLLKKKTTVQDIQSLFILYDKYMDEQCYNFNFHQQKNNFLITDVSNANILNFDISFVLSMNEGSFPNTTFDENNIPQNIQKKFHLDINNQNNFKCSFILYNIIKNSKSIYLIYDHNINHYNYGEKSRYIKYIQIFKKNIFINIQMDFPYYNTNVLDLLDVKKKDNILINKTKYSLNKLTYLIGKGISPYTLNIYLNSKLDFYLKVILNLHEDDFMSLKLLNHRIIGKIIHNSLFRLYYDYQNMFINKHIICLLFKRYISIIKKIFIMMNINYYKGQGLLMFHIVKMYIYHVIQWDERNVFTGNTIYLKNIEYKLSTCLFTYSDQNIIIKGIIDRIDLFNNELRIIDYKLNFAENQYLFKINSDTDVFSNILYDNRLTIQLLFYSLLCFNHFNNIESCLPSIFNYKLVKSNFLSSIYFNNNIGINKGFIYSMFKPKLIDIIKNILNKESSFIL
jgi:hypothetical protein